MDDLYDISLKFNGHFVKYVSSKMAHIYTHTFLNTILQDQCFLTQQIK